MKDKLKDLGTKKLLIMGGILLVVLVLLFGGALLYNRLFYKRSYSEVESIMLDASKKYMSVHEDSLPKDLNTSVSISVSDLIQEDMMKELNDYIKDDSVSCSGSVNVTKITDGYYRYVPFLDCKDDYSTLKFVDYIKKNEPIVESSNGLYQLNNDLVFRGDNVNNYLSLGGRTYQIVKITNDEVAIILSEKSSSVIWDNRYNVDKKSTMGINDYDVSKVRESLNSLYDGSLVVNSKPLLDENAKNILVTYSLEVGKRTDLDNDRTGTLEKAVIIENQYVGLLSFYDYMNASLDTHCTTTLSPACMNYNYLSNYQFKWWLGTATSSDSYRVYLIDKKPKLASASGFGYLRPVFHLAKDVIYVSGDGSLEKPYVVK